MSQNREEILADFQACTGIDDVGEAIFHLDETNWDLLQAINRVVPPDTQSFNAVSSDVSQDVVMVEQQGAIPKPIIETATDIASAGNHAFIKPVAAFVDNHIEQYAQPSTSNGTSSRMLRFNVSYCERVIPIDIPESGTVADLKLNLHNKLKIAPCRQLLSGWARLPQFENVPFSQLMLPNENVFHLQVKSNNGGFSAEEESEVTERLRGTYTLKVTDENTNKNYNLKYLGTKSIMEVKNDMFTLTDIPMRNQLWSGWPPNIDDQTSLALSGISYPEHQLTIKRNNGSNSTNSNSTGERKSSSQVVEVADSDEDEFEDAPETFSVDDEMFEDNLRTKREDPLIPDNVEDEIVGTISFSEQFAARYGHNCAPFYQGTLDDALKEACRKSAKDRKILAVYLHHDASVLSNVFCTQLLGCESVVQTLEANFIVWGWDLTFESNRSKLQNSVSLCLGSTAATNLKTIPVDRLPAIIIIMRLRSSTDIFSVVHGNVGVNDLLTSLIEAVEVFSEHQKVEIKEEEERAARDFIKWEQDQAYRASLEADRAKEEAKRLQEQAEMEERMRVQNEKEEEAAKKEAFRKQVEASLPPEPKMEEGGNFAKIRFRLPKGDNLERHFEASTPLKTLLDFLVVKGYPSDEYKVISSWPRRDLSSLDVTKSLYELKLCPQETVILEER